MADELQIRKDGAIDFISLGALVHRLDPGIIPFRKATECHIHVSGGEFNVAANLSNCFGLKTSIASAMSDYPIGDLIAERVRAMGVAGQVRERERHDSGEEARAGGEEVRLRQPEPVLHDKFLPLENGPVPR